MSATVYSFSTKTRSMVPIETDTLQIGQRVLQANRHEVGVVCEKGGPYSHGYTVIFEDGSESTGQQLDALSPFTRISVLEDFATVGPDEVNRLIQLRDAKRVTDRWEREQAATKKAADIVTLTAKLRAEYPWAIADTPNLSGHARAAKNIKKELQRTWPGVKFSVRSDSFSGGDSVDVSWTDGPNSKQVDGLINKYQDSSFDGMTDSSNYDSSAYGQAVETVLGRAKFVHGTRHYSDALIQKAIDRVAEKFSGNIKRDGLTVELTPANYNVNKLWNVSPYPNDSNDRHSFQALISQEVSRLGMMPKQ